MHLLIVLYLRFIIERYLSLISAENQESILPKPTTKEFPVNKSLYVPVYKITEAQYCTINRTGPSPLKEELAAIFAESIYLIHACWQTNCTATTILTS